MKILVIKHGALGDIVLAFSAFAAIRARHRRDNITLLTTAPFAPLLACSPWFDNIDIDPRPAPVDLPGILRVAAQLRGFDLVYDLQTSRRTARYFVIAGRPPWSGIARGATLPHNNPARNSLHTRERLAEQLAVAGIAALPPPDLAWLQTDIARFSLPADYAVLAPGAAPHRPEKRWPAGNFGTLAARLPHPAVIIGTAAETHLASTIRALAPAVRDLTGRTSLVELATIIAGARLAIGNDTGPMHLAAAFGVPSVVLFGGASDPALTAPRYPDGGWPSILRAPDLAALPVARVLAALP